MDWGLFGEMALILLLILLNGFFAGAEIAILTAKRGRLEQYAREGDRGAKAALRLSADADRFLPTVQVGITLVGTFAAAFGGASFISEVSDLIRQIPFAWIQERSATISLGLISVGIAFFSLILGELVPKRVALQNAEFMARWVAMPMLLLQTAAQPFVWFLRLCTKTMLRLLGQKTEIKDNVSVEDIQHLIDAGHQAGILQEAEQQMAQQALRMRERTAAEILRPRIDIDAIDIDTPPEEVLGAMAMSGFSRVPVCEGGIDQIVGFVYIKDVFLESYLGRSLDIRRIMRAPLFIPKTVTITKLLELFQKERTQLAIVLDEYGGTEGMVTLEDVMEILVGSIHDEHRRDDEQRVVIREDGSLLADASLNLHELQEALQQSKWSEPPPRGIATISGLVVALLKRPPKIGDSVTWSGLKVEIVDMDGPRVDRLMISRIATDDDEVEPKKTENPEV